MRHHAVAGSGRVRTRCRRSSHSSSAHCRRPAASSRSTSTSCNGEQVFDIGGRVRALLHSQRPARPVGETVALGESRSEQAFDRRRERRGAEADEPRRDLRVEQMRGDATACALEDRQILVGGVGNHATVAAENLAERGGINREGVNQRDSARPCELDQREARPIGTLAVKLRVERVARFAANVRNARCERVCSVDEMRFHHDSLPRAGTRPVHIGRAVHRCGQMPDVDTEGCRLCEPAGRRWKSPGRSVVPTPPSAPALRFDVTARPSIARARLPAARTSGAPRSDHWRDGGRSRRCNPMRRVARTHR